MPIHVDPFRFEVWSVLTAADKRAAIKIAIGDHEFLIDLPKGREILAMMQGAIEAAISDELTYRFLVERVGLPADAAAQALVAFREMRQGSRGTVYPH